MTELYGTDQALLTGLSSGKEEAYACLYDRYAPALYRTAHGISGSAQDAEDAVQEVFVALARRRSALQDVNDLRAYLFTSLRHATARICQRRQQTPLPSPEPLDDKRNIYPEQSAQLEACMRQLPLEQREVIAMKIDADLSFEAIGEVLEISPNTAASRYRYALERLRTLMGGAS